MTLPPPGWYPAPDQPQVLRYWDGQNWTPHTQPTTGSATANTGASAWAPAPTAIGPHAYSTATPATSYQPTRTPARVAMILLGASIAVAIVTSLAHLNRVAVVNDLIDDPLSVKLSSAQHSDDQVRLWSLVGLVTYLATGVAFIVWFHRVYKNTLAMGRYPRYSAGWAIGAWFVPFLNFVRPKQIADDLWRAASPTASHDGSWIGAPVAALVHWWWVLFITAGIVGWVTSRTYDGSSKSLESIRSSDYAAVAGRVALMVAAAVAIVFVQRLNQRQEAQARQLPAAR